MVNEYIIYSFLLSVILFAISFAVTKKRDMSGVVSFLFGVLCILFIFDEPKQAKELADLMSNTTLMITKVTWGLGWGLGLYICGKLSDKINL